MCKVLCKAGATDSVFLGELRVFDQNIFKVISIPATLAKTLAKTLVALVALSFFSLPLAYAQLTHERVKRVTVFPIHTPKELDAAAENSWWEFREKLTESKRFFVASKNFMQAKDVFQSRGELQPADALILGRLLDADALIVTYVVDRKLSMRVYETKNGLTLWAGDIEMHPAIQVSKQLGDSVKKLLYDFLATIPYQGAVVTDSIIGRPSYSEGEKLLFKADIGVGTQITVGDNVQLIRILVDKIRPVFQDGSTLEVFAEGKVVNVDRQIITVQVIEKQDRIEIKDDNLVRVPDELRRIKEMFGLNENSDKTLSARTMYGDSVALTTKQKATKPLVTSLAWIGNVALILLLAF